MPAEITKTPSRVDTLLPALIGLLGVLIGALVTAGFTAIHDRNDRIGETRTAKRLIAAEVWGDTQKLISVSAQWRRTGPLPVTVQWQAQGPTLARHVSDSTWKTVSVFYANLFNIEHSLGVTCILSKSARSEILTIAKQGAKAYDALAHEQVSNIGAAEQHFGPCTRN